MLEPYDARHLAKYLTTERGGSLRPQHGGRHCVVDLPDGLVVTIPTPAKANIIATPMAKHIANVIGKTYAEFRADLGHPVVNSGKPKRGGVRTEQRGYSKRDVKGQITELHNALSDLDHAIRAGSRDSSFYQRLMEHVGAARRDIDQALFQAQIGADR